MRLTVRRVVAAVAAYPDRKEFLRVDPQTGAIKWQGPLSVEGVTRASLTGADGKIYAISEGGKVVVFAAGDEYKVLAINLLGSRAGRALRARQKAAPS